MLKPNFFGELDFSIVSSSDDSLGAPDPHIPFRILVMGDFSGRAGRGVFEPKAALSASRLIQVDRDNIDEIMTKLGVEISLPICGEDEPATILQFSELDDFHPDRLYERLDLFKDISEKRKIAADPSFMAGYRRPATAPATGGEESALHRVVSQTSGSLLDQVLDETAGEDSQKVSATKPSEWDSFLDNIVQPHLVNDLGKDLQLISELDDTTGELMRAILHYPDFQEIEAAWRGVNFLVSRLDTGEDLQLYLLDLSKAELAEDLKQDDLRSCGIFRMLTEQAHLDLDSAPWGVMAGNYNFDSAEDLMTLGRMAKIAAAAKAPFIAAGGSGLFGSEPTEANASWNMLRRMPEARYLGLAAPGFLLRLPYGGNTDPAELFDFEEMAPIPVFSHYLWGNPAFACTFLLGAAFSESGWGFKPGEIQDIYDLPLHIYKVQGESLVTPCSGVVLTADSAEAVMEQGVMPLISFKDRDLVRLVRFQSVAQPSAGLAGRWDNY